MQKERDEMEKKIQKMKDEKDTEIKKLKEEMVRQKKWFDQFWLKRMRLKNYLLFEIVK